MNRMMMCFCCGLAVFMFLRPAWADKQKYTRRYQEKEAVYQEKKAYFQTRDLPNGEAYFEVSRKMPKVSVDYRPEQTAFSSGREKVRCRGTDTFSCTFFGAAFSVETDCEQSRLILKVLEKPKMKVEISSLYPKGDCLFDRVLKHELSHEEIYRKTLSSFLAEARRKLENEYVSGQRESKGCKEIKRRIDNLVSDFAKQYAQKAQAENDKLDLENGTHKYDFDGCRSQEK